MRPLEAGVAGSASLKRRIALSRAAKNFEPARSTVQKACVFYGVVILVRSSKCVVAGFVRHRQRGWISRFAGDCLSILCRPCRRHQTRRMPHDLWNRPIICFSDACGGPATSDRTNEVKGELGRSIGRHWHGLQAGPRPQKWSDPISHSPKLTAATKAGCARGGIGRHARLRIWFRKDWRFKSSRAHHSARLVLKLPAH